MATVTHAVTTPSTANATSYTTGSFTPAEGDLLVAIISSSGTALTGSLDTSSGIGFSHVVRTSSLFIDLFVADELVPASPGSMTVTWDITGDGATGACIAVFRVSGMERVALSAVRQYKEANGLSSATPEATFDASALTGNPTLVALMNGNNPPNVTEPSGWTEASDTGYSTPAIGQETATRDSGFTGTTITWGSTVASSWRVLTVEMDTSSADITVTPGTGLLTLTGFAPTVTASDHQTVTPGVGQLTLTGFAPTVSVSNNVTVTPGTGQLTLTGFAPTVTVGGNQSVTPGTGQLTLTGFAPTVTVSNHVTVTPGVGQLTLTGYAPTVSVTALVLQPLHATDRSGSRYTVEDRSGSRYTIVDRSGPRYRVTDRSNDGED